MSISAADIRTRFPGAFPTTSDWDAALTSAIAEAQNTLDIGVWGTRYDMAVLYKAAALAEAGKLYRITGASSYSAGQVSMTLGAGAKAQNAFQSLFDQLVRETIPPFAVSA